MPTPKKSPTKSTGGAQHISPIPQIVGYGATADGRIWSLASNWRGYGVREIAPTANGRGYLKVRLTLCGKRRNLAIHRLIAATFLPIRPSAEFEVCHKNGNRLDNRADNLCWGTRKDNADDRERHGHTSRGQRHSEQIKRGLAKSQSLYMNDRRAAIAKAQPCPRSPR